MATDKLIFPIGFDLEKGIADAQGKADKLLRRLEMTIKSRPLAIDLKINNAGSGSINEINARMRDIVKEWNNLTEAERVGSKTSGEYTERAKKLIAEFVRLTGATESYARSLQQITAAARKAANEQERSLEKQRKTEAILKAQENTIANITAKLQHWKKEMNSAEMGSKQFRQATDEVRRLSHSLTDAQRRVNALTDNFRKQDGYVSRLIKRLAVYAGYQQLSNFLTSVREVTAEFELQRISLGAIIQDQAKANQLFSEIKQFALKSPVKILDLTKYTKQLAAYKFETKELFDWTKRLTDISVGLGISMDRIILLAGQIRATGYLRGSEVRQATEAGIPLVEELAKKLEELNGRAYTTAEVMNLISERAISWEMVADVFKDMTSAGGMFFDIQEKQGNTLYGMWQKLSDAASVMYEEIGNTDSINAGMKNLISTLRTLMLNWKQTGAALATVGIAVLLYINRVKLADKMVELSIIAESKSVVALKSKQAALTRLIAIQRASTGAVKADTVATKLWTAAKIRGVQALNLMKAALKGLQAALVKNVWGIAILGLSLLVEKLWLAEDAIEKLKNKLSNIQLDYEVKQGQDASNFEYLANAAVEAAKGSKAQKDALEELRNTYGKIIPLELLTIENLERMKGNYGELIALIDEYNLKQKHEAETSAIEESFAPEQEKRAGIIREKLRKGVEIQYGNAKTFNKDIELGERNIQRFLLNLNKYAEEGLDKKEQIIKASADLAKELGLNELDSRKLAEAMIDLDRGELEGQGTLMDYTEALQRKHEALSTVTEDYNKAQKKLNEFSSVVDDVMKKNEDEPEVTTYNNLLENEKARLNNQIGDVASGIVELFDKAKVQVDSSTQQILQTVIQNGGKIPSTVWDILEDTAEKVNNPQLLAAIQSLRSHYQKLAPDNETVNFVRNGFIKIVDTANADMKEYRQYLYDGSITIKEYQGNLQTSIQQLKDQAFEMIRVNALIDAGLADGQKYDEATIKALQDRANNLQSFLDKYVTPLVPPDTKTTKSGGTKSDNRLSNLKEIESTLTSINTKYEELLKKEGKTAALDYISKNYKKTLDYVNKLGEQFELNFAMPTDFKDLQTYRQNIIDVIRKLKMKGYEKAAIELELKLAEGNQKKLEERIDKEMKSLADRISRTKTAKEFYEKILGQTGDVELAATLSFAVYGEDGEALKQQIIDNIAATLGTDTKGVQLDFTAAIRADKSVDYDELVRIAEGYKQMNLIADETLSKIKKMRDEDRKDLAKTVEGWLKATEKAKTYGGKLADVYRTTATEIERIEAAMAHGDIGRDVGSDLIAGYLRKEAEEVAKLQYEAFKDSPLYIQLFDDLDHASTRMLENMKARIEGMQGAWKDLDPTQLKELQSRLNEIDKQLAQRNPFKTLADSIREYHRLRTKGDARGNKTRKQSDEDVLMWSEAYAKAQEELARVTADKGSTAARLAGAKQMVDYTKRQKEEAEKLAERWKKVEDAIGLSANELFQTLNWAGEIAGGIATVMEALGGDQEDVQYWNDVASALGEIAGGIQNIVSAAMQGNVVGVVSSVLTSIPNMFAGFTNLFSAGKVKKANKEIERQQRLLDRLQRTYSNLEKTAERVFGLDYIQNYDQQLKNLEAQQKAYMRQAEAERSKGKKKDKEKIRQFEEAAADAADAIQEMKGKLAERMAGTDVASAARDFAKAWVDARIAFGSTTDAIKEKYQEMVKSMVVEGVMARAVQQMLQPMFDTMDEMLKKGDIYGAMDYVAENMEAFIGQADRGLELLWNRLQERTGDLNKLFKETSQTGIAKQVASATSEEINANTAALNTQNFYASKIPNIDANVAIIRQLMEGGGVSSANPGGIDTTALWNRHLELQQGIYEHTRRSAEKCEAMAVKCAQIADDIHKVVVPKGQTPPYKLYVGM